VTRQADLPVEPGWLGGRITTLLKDGRLEQAAASP
jgi:ferredoxin--NADP+ reductase